MFTAGINQYPGDYNLSAAVRMIAGYAFNVKSSHFFTSPITSASKTEN